MGGDQAGAFYYLLIASYVIAAAGTYEHEVVSLSTIS